MGHSQHEYDAQRARARKVHGCKCPRDRRLQPQAALPIMLKKADRVRESHFDRHILLRTWWRLYGIALQANCIVGDSAWVTVQCEIEARATRLGGIIGGDGAAV